MLMLMVLCRARGEYGLAVIDPKNDEVLHYEVLDAYPRKKKLSMDLEAIRGRSSFQIHNDLIDCQVDICSVEVGSCGGRGGGRGEEDNQRRRA